MSRNANFLKYQQIPNQNSQQKKITQILIEPVHRHLNIIRKQSLLHTHLATVKNDSIHL